MEVNPSKAALVVVDVQNDFCPGGSLAVREGDKVVEPLNKVIGAFQRSGLPIFFTRDWHPPNHISFKARGGPWPPHCIRETFGAQFHPRLQVPERAVIISKATEPDLEAYSGFQGTDLANRLKALGVTEIYLGGLTTDYCVRESSLDALEDGFKVNVLENCIRGVDAKDGDSGRALKEISEKGARLVPSREAIRFAEEHE